MRRPDRLDRLPPQYFVSLLARISAAAADGGPPILDLGRGNPETGPPAHVVEALRSAALDPGVHGYAPIRGLPRLREAIAARYRDVYGVTLDPDTEVAMVPGTKAAHVELALALSDEGETLLFTDPYYPDYPSGAALAGARRRDGSASAGARVGARARYGARGLRALPQLPVQPVRGLRAATGVFDDAVAWARRTGGAVVHDAAYIDIVFDGRRPQSFLSAAGAKDVGVEMWTMSKTYGMAGWRIGFVVGNAEIVERINLFNDHTRVGIFAPLQHAAIAALEGPQDSVVERVDAYERRRDVLGRLRFPMLPSPKERSTCGCASPRGSARSSCSSSIGSRVAPGEGFGPSGAGWARLSVAVTDAEIELGAERLQPRVCRGRRMKIGIVVPFSWSYWGGVVEHSEHQAAALRRQGHDVKILMGNDPPGCLTRMLHPRTGRHGPLPDGIIPVGRSVVVPANGSLPNIVLSPRTVGRVRRALAEEQFDVVHLHEPMTPAICVAALAYARCPIVVTHHAHGDLGWMGPALHFWGFLMDRVDIRIAVSPMAAESAARWIPDDYRVIPNGVLIPEGADPADRDHTVVFIGRHDPRKGLPTLLRAWPRIHQATGRAAAADRDRPTAVPPPARAPSLRRSGYRRARDRHERGAHTRARAREALGDAGTRRREFRARACRGVRVRDSGRRVGHPGLRGGRDPGGGAARAAELTPTRSPTPSSTCSRTSRAASRWAAPPARTRSRTTPGTTSRGGSRRPTSEAAA